MVREAIITAVCVQISLLVMTQILSPFVPPHFDNVTCVSDAGVTVAGNATCPGDISKKVNTNLAVPGDSNVPLQTNVLSKPNELLQTGNVPLQPQSTNVPLQSHIVSWSVRGSSNPILLSGW